MNEKIKYQISKINQKIKELNALYHMAALKAEIPDGEIAIWSVILGSDTEYSQQDLAELLFLPLQTIHSIIANLKKKEMIFLEHASGSRNKKIIRLTEKGRNTQRIR